MEKNHVIPFLLVLPTFTDKQKQAAEDNLQAMTKEVVQ